MSKHATLPWPAMPYSPVRASILIASFAALAACSDMPVAPEPFEVSEPSAGITAGSPNPTPTTAPSPFLNARLYVAPESNAARQAAEWRQSRPSDAAQMDKIAAQPQAIWFGDWNPEPYAWVSKVTRGIRDAGALPVYVLYNIPLRDCGLYSAGGATDAATYRRWISEIARAIGSEPAAVVLEPDALAGLDCLSTGAQAERAHMLADAVKILKSAGRISVYIDAGNPRWHPATLIADRLKRAGIEHADGFALNISNFLTTEENLRYGDAISALVGNKRYVVDTSRNGAGPDPALNWCNPAGRALGARPTTQTGHPRADAFLWLKAPGESDGECNGGPRAGAWWADYALGLANRSTW